MPLRGAAAAAGRTAVRAWVRWKVIARAIGNVQARILLSIFYFMVVPPFAIVVKIWNDPLQLHPHGRTTAWIERPDRGPSPETARRQF